MPAKQKSAVKRKTISRKGANLKKKRKESWSVEEVIPLEKHNFDLDTPPHLLSSSTKRNIVNDQVVESSDIDSENETDQTAINNDERMLDNEFRGDRANNKKFIGGCYDVGVESDEHHDEIQTLRHSLTQAPSATIQNENTDSSAAIGQRTIGENENNEQSGQSTREGNANNENDEQSDIIFRNEVAGERTILLNIDVLNSPMLTPQSNNIVYTENESVSNATLWSLDDYRENGNQSDSDKDSNESSNDNEVAQDVKNTQKMNIEDLINGGNTLWDEVMQRYKRDGTLIKKHRKAILEAIVQYALFKKIYINFDSMKDISLQICKVFPTETPTTYYLKIGNNPPSGQLYNLFHRKRAQNTKEEKRRVKPEETLLVPTESIDILKNVGHDDDVYIQKWRETFIYRQKKIKKYESYDDFVDEWPIIETRIGSLLINIDFKKIYKKRSLTSHNWNLFFANNWSLFTENINDKGLRFCKKVQKLKESSSKDAALSLMLHYILPPALAGHKWKPTYVTSQDTFLKYIKEECMDTAMENRNQACELRGIKWHPYVIGQGSSNRRMKHFYVVIHNTKIKTEDFLSALDLCMKIFILLKIPYPPESRAVWILINKIFYNLNVDNLMTSRILELVHKLK